MRNDVMTRRGFVATSAMMLTGIALAGCASEKREAPEDDPTTEQERPYSSSQPEADKLPNGEPNAADAVANGRVLVACFSATGNTLAIAEMLADHLDADLFEIAPADPYTEDDLNYNDASTRATMEQNDPSARPALAALPDFAAYDVVFLGHPIWWGRAPRLICTLAESAGVSGKRVAEFCTSGSSGIDAAFDELKGLAPEIKWIGTRRFAAGAAETEVAEWADSLDMR